MTFLCDWLGCEPAPRGVVPTWRASWREIQAALAEHGFDPGPVDGIRGPRTDEALRAFKASRLLLARDYIGEVTVAALAAPPKVVRPTPSDEIERESERHTGEPRWLTVARTKLGTREVKGASHSPTIMGWARRLRVAHYTSDEIPWCGLFVAAVLEEADEVPLDASKLLGARNWQAWGRALPGPALGAVVAMWRGSPSGWQGHVGFAVGRDRSGRLAVLGGNQSDAVTVAFMDAARVLSAGWRWSSSTAAPERIGWDSLPIVDGRGIATSRNEA